MVWQKDGVCWRRLECKVSSLLRQQVDPWTWPAEEKDACTPRPPRPVVLSLACLRLELWVGVRQGRTAWVRILTFLGLWPSFRRGHMPQFLYLQRRGKLTELKQAELGWGCVCPRLPVCLSVCIRTHTSASVSISTHAESVHSRQCLGFLSGTAGFWMSPSPRSQLLALTVGSLEGARPARSPVCSLSTSEGDLAGPAASRGGKGKERWEIVYRVF